jgi:hypothetical protein
MRPSEIDRLYLEEITASRYPVAMDDQPPLRIDITGVGQPTAPEEVGPAPDDLTAMATQMAAGTEPAGATPMSLAEAATSAADVPAGLLKGVVQGSIGLPGDIISLVRGVYDLGRSGGDVNAFLGGLEKATGLPTTEDVKKFFDETLGIPLVPAGASERRREAAKIPEFVGELGGAGTTAIEGTKAAVRGARQAVGATVDATRASTPETFVPQAVNKGKAVEIAPEVTIDIAPSVRTKNFKNWFGGSKVTDNKGKPLVMYHGTVEDNIRAFERNQLGLIFVTPSKKFANQFSMRGMGETPLKNIEAMEEDGLAPNVIPLYVSAKNPFDFANKDHVDAVIKALEKIEDQGGNVPAAAMNAKKLSSGDWVFLEDESVVLGVKRAGFDAMYVLEDGIKNIAVFDPNQLKSAIGNIGTFDPKNPDIARGVVPTAGAAAGAAAMQDNEEQM